MPLERSEIPSGFRHILTIVRPPLIVFPSCFFFHTRDRQPTVFDDAHLATDLTPFLKFGSS